MRTTQTIIKQRDRSDCMPDTEVIGTAEIDSGETSSLVLGLYENTFPQPEFHLDVEPKEASIKAALVKVQDGAEYRLKYDFQNFQNIPCKVTVRTCVAF